MSLTRRQFIQGGAAAGISLATVPASWASTPPLPSINGDIRVAVAGIRSRGHAHIEGFRRLEGVRVVALCDVDRGVLANRAAEFGMSL